jgi:hypothetical protein
MRRLRDVLAIFMLGAVAGTGAVAFAAATGPAPDTGVVDSPAPTTPLPPSEETVRIVVAEAIAGAVDGLPVATLRTLMRHGALEASTTTDLEAQLHPSIVQVLLHRRDAMAVFEESP